MAETTVRQDSSDFGKDHGLIHEAVVTGRKAGAGEAFWSALAHDEDLFRQVVQLVLGEPAQCGLDFCTLETAAHIMGGNFYGPAAVKKHLGVNLGRDKQFKSVPFSLVDLQAVAGTHLLVAAPAVSVMDIHGKTPQVFYSQRNPWYGEQAQEFAHTKLEPGWYLVRKDEVPDSTSRSFSEQQKLLADGEFVPPASLAVLAWVLHYLASDKRLFTRVWVRTSSVAAKGVRVVLRGDADGLHVTYWDDYASSSIGLAAARKSA